MRRTIYNTCVVIVCLAVILLVWKPWKPQSGSAEARAPIPPADMSSLTIIKRSGPACQVTILGTAGKTFSSSSASLAEGEARSAPMNYPAPFVIDAVTVTRDGSPSRQEINLTLAGGERYELLVHPDNSVVVAPVAE